MAKDLPYFKFFCSEWNDGDITLESYEAQGLFINICSYYWSNECEVHYDKLLKKFRGYDDIIGDLKAEGIIKINEDRTICINFLDEQLIERELTSKKNSEAGKKSAEIRRLKRLQQESNQDLTSVKSSFNESSTKTQPLREEKRREEKKREDNTFNEFWNKYPKKVSRKSCLNKWQKLKETDRETILKTIDNFVKYKPFKDYTHPNPLTYLNQERWNDEIKQVNEVKKFDVYKNL